MAQDLDLPKYVLSKYFNEVLSEGFLRSINAMRVSYACELLEEEDMVYTMEELAVLCGFNSRASFYRNFGHYEDCTPLEYRERFIGVAE